MNFKEPPVSSIVIHVPVNLAVEFFRETGDLPYSRFPATMKLAESIGKLLDMDHVEALNSKQSVLCTNEPKASQRRRLPR